MENRPVVDQRRERILAAIEARREQLAHQGTIVASYRQRGGRKVGPYFRLAYREGSNQRSLYLGSDVELIAEVGRVLQNLQQPERQQCAVRRCKAAIRTSLAHCRAELRRELAIRGLRLQGYEVRGWRTPGARRAATIKDPQDLEQPQGGVPTSGEPMGDQHGTSK